MSDQNTTTHTNNHVLDDRDTRAAFRAAMTACFAARPALYAGEISKEGCRERYAVFHAKCEALRARHTAVVAELRQQQVSRMDQMRSAEQDSEDDRVDEMFVEE